jgi:hypothetical protein
MAEAQAEVHDIRPMTIKSGKRMGRDYCTVVNASTTQVRLDFGHTMIMLNPGKANDCYTDPQRQILTVSVIGRGGKRFPASCHLMVEHGDEIKLVDFS